MSESPDEAKSRKRPPPKKRDKDQPQESAFDRFAALARRLVRVPKSEVSKDDSTSDSKS